MSDNDKLYNINELSELTGAPRTTVNDWLSRHSQFIDFKVQGKRKLYTAAALAVLREISELRDKGLSSYEIEKELIKRHPVHAVYEAPPEFSEGSRTDGPENVSGQKHETAGAEDFSLIVKKHYDDIGRILSGQLQALNQKMDEFERDAAAARKKAGLSFAAVLLLVPVLLIISVWAFMQINEQMKVQRTLFEKKTELSVELEGKKSALAEKERELSEAVVTLDKKSDEFSKNIGRLQKEQAAKEEEFKKAMSDARDESARKLFEERDRFAREQLERLKQIVALYADGANAEKLLETYSRSLSDAQQKANPPPPAPHPVKIDTGPRIFGAGENR
jgi:DNA-binding transcriptional MerR regulator